MSREDRKPVLVAAGKNGIFPIPKLATIANGKLSV
jgi:hypothetical protein